MTWAENMTDLTAACLSDDIGSEAVTFTDTDGNATAVSNAQVFGAGQQSTEGLSDGAYIDSGTTILLPTATVASNPDNGTITHGGTVYSILSASRFGNVWTCACKLQTADERMTDGTKRGR